MAAPKERIGTGECPACKREIVWKKSAGGAMSCFCQWCDFQGYAKHGTEAERLILKTLTLEKPAAPPAVDPAPAPKPEKKTEPAPKKTGAFGLGAF